MTEKKWGKEEEDREVQIHSIRDAAEKNIADTLDLKRQEPEDQPTLFPEIRHELFKTSIQKKICLLLLPFSLLLIAILAALNITTIYEVPLVLPLANTLFLGIIPIVIAYVTFRVYTKSGSASVLLIGSGILLFGLGSIVAGWVNPFSGGPNMTVTIHNTCACIGSILILAGAVISHASAKSGRPTGNTGTIAAAYTAIVIFVTIFSFATLQGMIPPFFIPGSGPTMLRQIILENATALFALSSVLFMVTYRKERTDFFFWYSVALALIAIGLLAVFVQPSVGSLIGWVGRSAQYIGFIFALYAVLIARKTATAKGLHLEDVIANFFVDAEQSYKQLVETATDAIVTIDEDYRVLLWNSAAERMFGYPRDDAIGTSFLKLVIDDPYIAVIKNNEQDISGRDIPVLTPEPVEIVGKRKSGALFPVELTVSRRWQEGRLIQTCIMRDISERKVAEEALYMSLVMDGVPTQFSYVDADLRFVYVNKAYAEWYGKTINELKGKSIRDVKGDEVFLQELPHYQRALSGKQVFFERIIPDTEGKEHFVIITLIPHFKGERVIGFFASIMDITERKVAEEALRESEYNLKEAQRVGHLGSWDLNIVTGDLLWSDECYRIYGFRPQEFVPTYEKFQQIVHPEDLGFVQEHVDAALNNNKHYDLDFRFMRHKGETGWIHVEGEVTWDTEGKPIRFFGTQIDITERKRAEETLARKHEELNAAYEQMTASEEELQAKYAELASSQSSLRETTNYLNNLLDYANAPIIVWDPSQRITRFNHAFERLTGRTSIEVLGQPLEILFPAQSKENSLEMIKKAISGEHWETAEIPILHVNGSIRTVIWNSATLLADDQKTVVATIAQGQDITDRKLAEGALIRVNQKLNVITNLTRQDLTNQLFVLKSYLEMTKKNAAGQDRILEGIQKCEKAILSINEITEFTKDFQEMGVKPSKWQNVKMALLLGLSHISIGNIQHRLETENLEIFADPLLEKVCQSLFENSVKHGGHVTLVRVWHTITPGGFNLVFEDNGIGIPQERKEQIFLRSDGPRASMRSLIFVREILDITGITIAETGEPGKGARFEMVVPKGAWRIVGKGD